MGKLITFDARRKATGKHLLTLLLRNGAYVLLILMCLIMAILDKNFLTASNLMNVALQSSIMGGLALGMTFVICTGNIDISVGNYRKLDMVEGDILVIGLYMPEEYTIPVVTATVLKT